MGLTDGRRRAPARGRSLALLAAIAACATTAVAAPAGAYDAKIIRTTGGIPHIKGATLGDAGFGVGFAGAQDNICTLAESYLTGRAERARFLGAGAGNANVTSDFFYQSIKDDRTIERLLDQPFPEGPSDDARELAAGYAAGYNRYLASKGGAQGIEDPRCSGKDWVRPITELDVWRMVNQLGMRASSEQFLSDLAAAAPPATAGARRMSAEPQLTEDEIAGNLAGTMFDPHAEPTLGSNAIGIGRDAATDGNGLVLGNPHFPWAGNERFWEFHLQVPGDLDVIGASLMGSPVVNIGHNRHVAWSHTVSTGRRFTLFALKLVPGTPTSYVYGDQQLPMRAQDVSVKVRQSDGTLTDATHTWYFTRFGRVTRFSQLGFGWSTSTAYAMKDANADNLRLFDQWLAMDRAGSAQELIDAQKRIQGIPWVNTLGADDQGNAFYTDLSVVPNVPASKLNATCVPSGTATAALSSRLYVLDGSKPECDWSTDPDAVRPGIFGASNLPHVLRSDYVQNSNDSHWLTNPAAPLTGFSPLIGAEGGTQGLRTRLGNMIVRDRLTGADGLGGTKFTLDTLKRSWTAFRNLGAELTLPGLRQICASHPSIDIGSGTVVDVTGACPVLDAYDGSGKRDSAGGWLFARWWANTQNTSAAFFTTPFDPADPVGTPATLNTALASSTTALGKAVKELRDRQIPLDATWGDVQKATRGADKIAIPGCNTGCYPVTSVSTSASSYGEVQSGSSFVMFAEMDPDTGPRAQALLTYSQSEDSTSPWFKDQTERFSNDRWITLPFRRAEIAKDAVAPPRHVRDPKPGAGQGEGGHGGGHGDAGPKGGKPATERSAARR